MQLSLIVFVFVRFFFSCFLLLFCFSIFKKVEVVGLLGLLFPGLYTSSLVFFRVFFLLFSFNVIRLICYRYPVTTTLSFNLLMAFSFWWSTVLLLLIKVKSSSRFLPLGSPWYLVPFLRIVEVVSLVVRPITLCFRLLANIRAGHIMLGLMCKLPFGTWVLGGLFGVLELMVSIVQAFVFTMLVRVYYIEALTH